MYFSTLLVTERGTWPSHRPGKLKEGRSLIRERKEVTKVLSSIHHVPGPGGGVHIVTSSVPYHRHQGLRITSELEREAQRTSVFSLGGRNALAAPFPPHSIFTNP